MRQPAARGERDDLTRQFLGLISTLAPHQLHALRIMMENHRNPAAAYFAAFRWARALGHNRQVAAISAREWAAVVGDGG